METSENVMKLPDDPKEKMKVLLLIAVGILATILALVQGVMYLTRQEAQLKEQLADLEWKANSAARDVISAEGCRPKNAVTLQTIVRISETSILHPILGNYRLGASELIERISLESGVKLDTIQEVGILDIPKPNKKTGKNVLKAYTVRLSMECGYYQLCDFVRRLEDSNPYLCVSSLSVIGQAEADPESHRVVLAIQWPIWANYEMSAQMMERMSTAYEGKEGHNEAP